MAKRTRINKRYIRKAGAPAPIAKHPQPKTVEQAQDAIIELLIDNERYTATALYAEWSRQDYITANETIVQFDKLLKSTQVAEREEQFLQAFRQSLLPVEVEQPVKRIDRPRGERRIRRPAFSATPLAGDSPAPFSPPKPKIAAHDRGQEPSPKGLRPLLLHTLLAQCTLLAALLLTWLASALLSFLGAGVFSMIFALLAGGVGFLLFPALITIAAAGLKLRAWIRSPGFLYDMALGAVFLIASMLGSHYFGGLLWQQSATLIDIEDPAYLVDGTPRPGSALSSNAIYRIQGLVAKGPSGTLKKWRRSGDNKSSTPVYWYARPLRLDKAPGAARQDTSCLWLGWRPAGSTFNLSLPYSSADNGPAYFRVNPAERSHYRKAVSKALQGEPPTCIQVLEHIPPPQRIAEQYGKNLKILLLAVGAAPWGLLLIASMLGAYRKLRRANPEDA